MCKQMGLDTNFAGTDKAVTTSKLDTNLVKTEYAQVCSYERKKNKGNKLEGAIPNSKALVATKANYEKAVNAVEAVKLDVNTEGAKPFELHRNLLSNEARQPWGKMIKSQVTRDPWEDVYGVTHAKTSTKTWESFCECITFHLQQVFHYDVGETLKC